MRHKKAKLSIATSIILVTIGSAFTMFCFTLNSVGGYALMALSLFVTFFVAHRLYRKLWFYNWGRPLSEEKRQKREQYGRQARNYQPYELRNRMHRFADLTELDYQAKKAQERAKKLKH